ncbi:hypothetical protein M0R45_019298 [Rubus argutus]|uniref:Uncharacterized protein n=1 Tax=Rubus argutus TaxID=59490 RepID=A0AAW1X5P1_RUBAR
MLAATWRRSRSVSMAAADWCGLGRDLRRVHTASTALCGCSSDERNETAVRKGGWARPGSTVRWLTGTWLQLGSLSFKDGSLVMWPWQLKEAVGLGFSGGEKSEQRSSVWRLRLIDRILDFQKSQRRRSELGTGLGCRAVWRGGW